MVAAVGFEPTPPKSPVLINITRDLIHNHYATSGKEKEKVGGRRERR